MDPPYGPQQRNHGQDPPRILHEQMANLSRASRQELNPIHGYSQQQPNVFQPYQPPGLAQAVYMQPLPPNAYYQVYDQMPPSPSFQPVVYREPSHEASQHVRYFSPRPPPFLQQSPHPINQQPTYQYVQSPPQHYQALNAMAQHGNQNFTQPSPAQHQTSFSKSSSSTTPTSLQNQLNSIDRILPQLQVRINQCAQKLSELNKRYKDGQTSDGLFIASLMHERKEVLEDAKKNDADFSHLTKKKLLITTLLRQDPMDTRQHRISQIIQPSPGQPLQNDMLTPPPTPQSPDSSGMRSPYFLMQPVGRAPQPNPSQQIETVSIKEEPRVKEELQEPVAPISKSRLKRVTTSSCIDLTETDDEDEEPKTFNIQPTIQESQLVEPRKDSLLSARVDRLAEEYCQRNFTVLEESQLPELMEVVSGDVAFGSAEFDQIVRNELERTIETSTKDKVVVKEEDSSNLYEEEDVRSTSSDDIHVQLYDEEFDSQTHASHITETETVTETDSQMTISTEIHQSGKTGKVSLKRRRSDSNSSAAKEIGKTPLKRLIGFDDSSSDEDNENVERSVDYYNSTSSSSTYDLPVLCGTVKKKSKKVTSTSHERKSSASLIEKSKKSLTKDVSSKKPESRERSSTSSFVSEKINSPIVTDKKSKRHSSPVNSRKAHPPPSITSIGRSSDTESIKSRSSATSSRPPFAPMGFGSQTSTTGNSILSKRRTNSTSTNDTPLTNSLGNLTHRMLVAEKILRLRKQKRNRKKSTKSASSKTPTAPRPIKLSNKKDKKQINFGVYSSSKNIESFFDKDVDLSKEVFAPPVETPKKKRRQPDTMKESVFPDKPARTPISALFPKKSTTGIRESPKAQLKQPVPVSSRPMLSSPKQQPAMKHVEFSRNFFNEMAEFFGNDANDINNDSYD